MSRGRILVADDNPDIVRLVEVNLQFEQYATISAHSGEEALELARRERPDLILLDVMMGSSMDGWQVLGALKADASTVHIPVVIMTGSSIRDRRERELVEEVASYIPKPFNPALLLEVVNDLVGEKPVAADPPLPEPSGTIRVALIDGGEDAAHLLQNLMGVPSVEVVAVVGPPAADAAGLAAALNLPVHASLDALPANLAIDLFVDRRATDDPALRTSASRTSAEILRGRALAFLGEMLAARDASHVKERDLVRELKDRVDELTILNDVARLVAASLSLADVCEQALRLTLRIGGLNGGAVLVYEEREERFVPVARVGLSARFDSKARLPLSDPLVAEMLTLRHALTVSEMDERFPSLLMGAAVNEGLASMACLPLTLKDKVIGLLVTGTRERYTFRSEELVVLTSVASQIAMVIENTRLQQASREKQALIEKLLGKVVAGQEDERKRLASEIHDSVAQSLAAMLSNIQVCQALLGAGAVDEVKEQLAATRSIIADSVREVRTIIFNLRPSSLDDLGLVPSIENYLKRFTRENGVESSLDAKDMPARRLPSTLETTIFRVVQESLTNVKKHARARTVKVRLGADATHVSVTVVDDGCGFDAQEMSDKFRRGESHGVEGMRERTAFLGGSMRVQSRKGEGTAVVFELPLPRASASEEASAEDGSLVVQLAALNAVDDALARLGERALETASEPARAVEAGGTTVDTSDGQR